MHHTKFKIEPQIGSIKIFLHRRPVEEASLFVDGLLISKLDKCKEGHLDFFGDLLHTSLLRKACDINVVLSHLTDYKEGEIFLTFESYEEPEEVRYSRINGKDFLQPVLILSHSKPNNMLVYKDKSLFVRYEVCKI